MICKMMPEEKYLAIQTVKTQKNSLGHYCLILQNLGTVCTDSSITGQSALTCKLTRAVAFGIIMAEDKFSADHSVSRYFQLVNINHSRGLLVDYLIILGKFSQFFHKNICFVYSLEEFQQGTSNENMQGLFLWRNKKIHLRISTKYSSLTSPLTIALFVHFVISELQVKETNLKVVFSYDYPTHSVYRNLYTVYTQSIGTDRHEQCRPRSDATECDI